MGERTLKELRQLGYKGKLLRIELESIKGGGKTSDTISIDDFKILALFAASNGKRKAMRIISGNSGVEQVKKLESKTKRLTQQKGLERQVQINLSKSLHKAKIEVMTVAGKIDILTEAELIEIKEWKRWKEAIGQVLCYGRYYPEHSKRIHFFGSAEDNFIELVKSHCLYYDIIISWEKD